MRASRSPSATFEGALLDSGVVRTSTGRSLRPGMAALREAATAGDGLIVGVFGHLTSEDAREMAQARRGAAACVAVIVGENGTGPEVLRMLRVAGWRVLTVPSAAALETAWTEAGGFSAAW